MAIQGVKLAGDRIVAPGPATFQPLHSTEVLIRQPIVTDAAILQGFSFTEKTYSVFTVILSCINSEDQHSSEPQG